MSLRGDVTGQVDDNANLSGYQADVVTELAQRQPGPVHLQRLICDPSQPFVVNGTSAGATALPNFTPSGGSLSGSFTFAGSGQGFSFSGGGPYRIVPGDGGNGTLEMNRSGCVDIGSCKSEIDRLSLTPLTDTSSCR